MIVDTSALVELLLQTHKASRIEAYLRASAGLDAPHLVDIETAQVLRRLVLRGEVDASRARQALDALTRFPMRRHPHTSLLPRLWEWRDSLSAYDAAYVALAEALDVPLLTCDARLGRATGGCIATHVV